ncbi:MAG: orotidine 5'-phosphate decarboxylase / HUMPS family protein [Eubacteriales bacterium]|nr:orotidine 5'-phosphate decarboxylase / HUMPS family protein [Eubacteriales bacterium]
MRIQAAIDRVSLEKLFEIGSLLYGNADIVEVGTSLTKDYGMEACVGGMRKRFPDMCILADIKTCDEGAYEFRQAYKAGADIATVMGFSSNATIKACAEVAREFGREYFIDLMEVSDERTRELAGLFPDGIFGIHLPSDMQGEGLGELVKAQCACLKKVHSIAAAGGVKLESLPLLKREGVEIAIVGGAITKAENMGEAAAAFAAAAK